MTNTYKYKITEFSNGEFWVSYKKNFLWGVLNDTSYSTREEAMQSIESHKREMESPKVTNVSYVE